MRRFVPHRTEGLDGTGLEKATDAFRRGDYARAVGTCLGAETGFTLRTMQFPEGPGWTLIGKESTVFVAVELVPMQLVVEAPVARLPRTQRVGAMRLALELCDDERMSSRWCLRDDLLLMRFVAQLGAAPPALVRHVVLEMLEQSERCAELFVAAFDARNAARGDARGSGGLDTIGRRRKLGTLHASTPRHSVVPPPPSTLRPDFSPSREEESPSIFASMFGGDSGRNSPPDDVPPILAPPTIPRDSGRAKPLPPEDIPPILAPPPSVHRDNGRSRNHPPPDDIPPILAPPTMMRDGGRGTAPSVPSVTDDIPPILAHPTMMREPSRAPSSSSVHDDMPPILAPPSMLRDNPRSSPVDDMPAVLAPSMFDSPAGDGFDGMPAVLMPFEATPAPPRAAPPASSGMSSGASSEREIPPVTARLGAIPAMVMNMPLPGTTTRQRTAMGLSDPSRLPVTDPETDVSGRKPSGTSDKPSTPADKLCELLHRAQTLATALSFAERPATMLLLVRAAVYRAVHEYGDSVPDAVAYLHRMTSGATRTIWSSSIPVDKRGSGAMPMAEPALLAMERVVALRAAMPKEPKVTPEPLTTAAQAREHLAKFVEEIELAPNEPALRHFLASGALCELLARARLPSQTAQRIKDIVAHAQREVSKPLPPEQLTKALNSTLDLMMAALKRIITG